MSTSSPFISGHVKKKIGVLGASGYTGADAVRLLARHPGVEISALTANTPSALSDGSTIETIRSKAFCTSGCLKSPGAP